jgi:hypothetical protein
MDLDPHVNQQLLVPVVNFILNNYGKPFFDWLGRTLSRKKPPPNPTRKRRKRRRRR